MRKDKPVVEVLIVGRIKGRQVEIFYDKHLTEWVLKQADDFRMMDLPRWFYE